MDINKLISSWEDLRLVLQGLKGESIIRKHFLDKDNCTFTQLDMLANISGTWYSVEIKHQERYERPDGHGLPPWQVDMRLRLYHEKGIIPLLFIVDKDTGEIFYQNLKNLDSLPMGEKMSGEGGEKFKTKTGKRIIYKLSNFEKLDDL